MKNSTKWFLIICGILIFIGLWGTLFIYVIFRTVSESETEVISGSGDRIAVVDLVGTILRSEETVRQLKRYREDHSIKGILFRVDSPGGGVVASQEIYDEVRKTRRSGKPVVVSMGALAASGGYYVSCGASRIVANPGTLTGSIGVISEFLTVDSLLHKIGVEATVIKSGRLKDAGSPFRQMTPPEKEYFQRLMDDVHTQFIAVVEKERRLPHDSVMAMADGRVFTGAEAVRIGLVDTLGTAEDAIEILSRLAHIRGEPTLVKERKYGQSLFERIFGETKIPDFLGLKEQILDQPLLQYKMPQTF